MAHPSTRLSAYIDGIGILGPGLANWAATRDVITGAATYVAQPLSMPQPAMLPPAERRRVGVAVKAALAVAKEALDGAQADPRQMATVFSSSGADGDNCDAICKVLASDDRHISPTRFHNSVHNAPAGYWGIASGAMTPATVLCAFDGSFGAGLLEAMTQIAVDRTGTLLVTYDAPYPEPLHAKRPLPSAFGLALALMPEPGPHSLARLEVTLTDAPATPMANTDLESLRQSIPCARGMPLLQALVRGDKEAVLDYLQPQRLAVTLTPCP